MYFRIFSPFQQTLYFNSILYLFFYYYLFVHKSVLNVIFIPDSLRMVWKSNFLFVNKILIHNKHVIRDTVTLCVYVPSRVITLLRSVDVTILHTDKNSVVKSWSKHFHTVPTLESFSVNLVIQEAAIGRTPQLVAKLQLAVVSTPQQSRN